MVAKPLSEAEKMRRVPGISFMDGPAGRRAHVDGTGLDVWEVIQTYLEVDRDVTRLKRAIDWLTPGQLQTALAFYAQFPDEIDVRLAGEAEITPETLPAYLAGDRD
jgi:uncharacterized protein (DUF433 family)